MKIKHFVSLLIGLSLLMALLSGCGALPGQAAAENPPARPIAQARPAAQAQPAAQVQPAVQVQPAAQVQPTVQAQTADQASLTADLCLNNTRAEGDCKDCCDSLSADGAARRACRDQCPAHDFTQNTNFILMNAPSSLGPQGDYSLCTAAGNEGACKDCCDSSSALQAGDRRFCRDTCAGKTSAQQPGDKNSSAAGSKPAPPPSGGKGNPSGGGKSNPPGGGKGNPSGGDKPNDAPQPGQAGQPGTMTIEQAVSDEAQRNTIAFDALAFLTGDLGADSFFPPGKVADFWGFQYLRDNDPSQMGHNTDFLTRAALNMLTALTSAQRAELITLAKGQVDDINQYAANRFVLMEAFRRLLNNDLPAGSAVLNESAVKAYSAKLYRLDGEISYDRAQVMGAMIGALTADQRAYLDKMVGKGMLDWPDVQEPAELQGLDRDTKVAVMTYAGDMFSWYAGSVEADVYFCPERQGTYFGSFYLKDAPAMGNPDYTISSTLTGDTGRTFLETLTPDQSQLVTGLVDTQRPYLLDIVETRRQVSTQLRQFMSGGTPDRAAILSLMEQYGELDGAIIYNIAVNFVQVNRSLTAEQQAQLTALRAKLLGDMTHPSGAYLYSQPIAMPEIPNTDFLFAP